MGVSDTDLKDFIRAVATMRHWQRTYFKQRSATALQEAKRAERQVDDYLACFECENLDLPDFR